ncbi:hypothetical protein WJX84_011831 [Apatococcus fuscideae]|uniref:Di19 zinc-binding domain-containing protein n=1 Tax=Apatococcus fuscideae TaxID=2026836 RepID=A0AAW1SP83_9CHLO
MQTDAFTEALLREKRQATSGASSSSDAGASIESACPSFQNGLACPYCPKEPLDFQGLLQHLDGAHGSYPQRAAKCPVCRRTARDMVPHLMQHVSMFEEDECGCSLSLDDAPDQGSQVAYQDLQMSLEGGDPQAETPETAAGAASSQDVGPSAISKPGLAGTTEPRQMAAGPLGAPAAASKAADPPPPLPGGRAQDTIEMRAAFVRQMMLSVFDLGR